MTTNALVFLVLTMHHGHRVPANEALKATFQGTIAWVGYFLMLGYGIRVGRDEFSRHVDASLARSLPQRFEDLRPVFRTLAYHDIIEGLYPLCNLIGKICLDGKFKFCIHTNRPIYLAVDSKLMILSSCLPLADRLPSSAVEGMDDFCISDVRREGEISEMVVNVRPVSRVK